MAKQVIFLYKRKNYYLILASVSLLIVGMLLMSGSSNDSTDTFNKDIYSFRRLTLAPLILFFGYILMIYSLMSVSERTKAKKNG
jgi:hypothetical protein